MADVTTAIMPTSDWIAICNSITSEFGENFPFCSGDVPELLEKIADGTAKTIKEGTLNG